MKHSSHIGVVAVENVKIYHDLGYILVICEYLQHNILACLRRRALQPLTTAYKCLQHICKELLNFGNIMQFSKFGGG